VAGQSTRGHGPAIFCVGEICTMITGAGGGDRAKASPRQMAALRITGAAISPPGFAEGASLPLGSQGG
jgi:hypothetical protein